jgi:hypothetical protein
MAVNFAKSRRCEVLQSDINSVIEDFINIDEFEHFKLTCVTVYMYWTWIFI